MQNSPKDLRKKILGRQGEELVCKYLKRRRYKILERNFVTPFGEADIIAYKRGMYVFVEVKTRESDIFGLPSEAVDRRKRQKYVAIAEFYCLQGGRELPVRFDVASVYDGKILEYIESAFERESEF